MKRFSNVLLIADAALESSEAMERAVAFALNNQASLTLVDIVDDVSAEMQLAATALSGEELSEIMVSDKREQLEKIVNATEAKGVDIEVKVLVGKPFLETIRQVLQHKHDLVIKCVETSKRSGAGAFGSTDMHLIRKCPCPVWMIKNQEQRHKLDVRQAIERRLTTITKRERQVLDRVVAGKSNKAIAFELNLSHRTVEVHRSHVMEKMQARSLAELVKLMQDVIKKEQ